MNRALKELEQGGNMILEYCAAQAKKIGAPNAQAFLSDNFYDDIKSTNVSSDSYTLSLASDSKTIEVKLSRVEIEDYPGEAGIAKTQAKLRACLHEIANS